MLGQLYTNRGRTLELSQQYESAQDNYQEMIDLAAERNDSAMRLAALTSQCIVRATQTPLFNLAEARILAEEALTLARQLGDKATEAKVLWGMLLVATWGEGDHDKALAYGLRSLELARELDLKEQMGFTYQDLANVYRNLNQLDRCPKDEPGSPGDLAGTGKFAHAGRCLHHAADEPFYGWVN